MQLADIESVAAELAGAYASRVPVRPSTEAYDSLALDDAYAIQQVRYAAGWQAGR